MIGVALEGGGAKGSYQVGVMKALYEFGVFPDVVVGSSIGAINGAFIATGQMEALEALWLNSELEDMIDADAALIRKTLKFDLKNDYNDIGAFILETLKKGGLDTTPLKVKLKSLVDEETLRTSKMEYGLVTVSLTDFKPIEVFVEDIPYGKLHDYIIASANFPAFKMEKVEEKKLVDGGFSNNLPINLLIDKGCDRIYAIRLLGKGRLKKFKNKNLVPIEYIVPSEDLGHTLGISSERAKHNIKLGYLDAMRVLKKMKSSRYYVDKVPENEAIMHWLNQIDHQVLDALEQALDSRKAPLRMLYEAFIPLLADILELSAEADYATIAVAFLEEIAAILKIDRLKEYAFHEFVERIRSEAAESDLLVLDQTSTNPFSAFYFKSRVLLNKKNKTLGMLQIYKILYDHF